MDSLVPESAAVLLELGTAAEVLGLVPPERTHEHAVGSVGVSAQESSYVAHLVELCRRVGREIYLRNAGDIIEADDRVGLAEGIYVIVEAVASEVYSGGVETPEQQHLSLVRLPVSVGCVFDVR